MGSEPNVSLNYKPNEMQRVSKPWYIEDFRFGGGVGYGLYVTNQMDYEITTNYGNFKELIPTYYAGIYKNVNRNIEMGVQARFGKLLSLKSQNTQGTSCEFTDAMFSFVYSFNDNVAMERKPFTVNGILSLGVINFRSKYFTVDTKTQVEDDIISSVGYNNAIKTGKIQPERQTALIANTGIALGYRLNHTFSVYWETTYNMSSSKKMSGNLFKRSLIPPDGYLYSSVGLFIRFGSKRGQLSCPKF
ncbi:MAG: hypothetical protein MH472_11185 [Bacteroidia bacterium]|nr:hypothetical protein [Bacteroidia bacterium]